MALVAVTPTHTSSSSALQPQSSAMDHQRLGATRFHTPAITRPSRPLPSNNTPGKYALDPEIFSLPTSASEDVPAQETDAPKRFNSQGPTVPMRGEATPIYPSDEPGEEMSELSRVWRIYVDEAAKFDASLTEGCNRGIDVLLVFTGLFAAVLTTFIIQSYQLLTPGIGDTTNALLTQLIAIQAHSAGIQLTPATIKPPASPNQMRWVNGLWFSALSCSLSTALISMLAKQWLQAYISNISGSPHHRTRQRQSRYIQLQMWKVLPVINALPLLLHVALLLFFAGLIVLLWSVDLPITIATCIIVTLAYTFYCASIWLPLIYPDCPYQHPLSDYVRKWLSMKQTSGSKHQHSVEPTIDEEKMLNPVPPIMTRDDQLDASALAWLFTRSTDKQVTSAALQAIAGLPRDFSATHILREADALNLVEQGFQSCFEKDTTVGVKWHLLDVDGAWLYCKAWMNLTRGVSKQWPLELVDPLRKLQDFQGNSDASATASSLVAVSTSSLDTHMAQWDLVAYLSKYVTGKEKLSDSTVCWLLDSITESVMHWQIPIAVIERTALSASAVPVLIRLLRHTEHIPTSHIRSATALALHSFTCGPIDLHVYQSEELRRLKYYEVMLTSLSKIATNPSQFGVTDPLLDITATELSKLASPAAAHSTQLSFTLKNMAMTSLLHLFTTGRVAVGKLPDTVLADVLHLLCHIPRVPPKDQPLIVKTLVDILGRSSHPNLATWSVRLLKKLLAGCPISVVQTFTESGGISAVLRTVKEGGVGHQQLQGDSWRILCICVNASIMLGDLKHEPPSGLSIFVRNQLDAIFHSDLFETFCSAITSRPWWLIEVSDDWIPTLAKLCRLRPYEGVWRSVIKVINDANAKTHDHQGISEAMNELENMLQSGQNNNDSDSVDLDDEAPDDDDIGVMTMMEQRSNARPYLVGRDT